MKNWLGVKGISIAALIAGAAATGVLLTPNFAQSADAKPIVIEAPLGAPVSFADLIEQVSPAVVSVNVVTEQEISGLANPRDFFDRFPGLPRFEFDGEEGEEGEEEDDGPITREGASLGSGFFISDDGFVVTNNHVVENAIQIEVVLSSGEELEAELIGTDEDTDLAVLKIKDQSRSYPFVEFANSEGVRRGDWVVALGNPFGLNGTATAGIVSAKARELAGNGNPYTDFLQIDAAINQGNSGGPTFDLYGRVIGVNTLIFSRTGGSVGVGFAIPAELASRVTTQLRENGRVIRGWLGVTIQNLTEDTADALGLEDTEGAIISSVDRRGPAYEYGLERSDVVIALNGQDVVSSTDLTRRVGRLIAGSTNEFEIIRDGEVKKIRVTVGERPGNLLSSLNNSTEVPETGDVDGESGPLGLVLQPIDERARTELGLEDDETGLLIIDITPESVLHPSRSDSGLRPGYAILEVNGNSVETVEKLAAELDRARDLGREQVLMSIRVGRATVFTTAPLNESEE